MVLWIEFGYLQVTQFTPTVMMCLSIGLGIDYTLFLLSRVLMEVKKLRKEKKVIRDRERIMERRMQLLRNYNGATDNYFYDYHGGADGHHFHDSHDDNNDIHESNEEISQEHQRRKAAEVEEREIQFKAIYIMIRHAGHTILISGITLMFTFLGLSLFPVHALQSVSIGASTCILFCIIVNLVIVPALLHSKLGYKLIRFSRPRRGGTGMDIMKRNAKDCYSSLRKKYLFWRYKSRSGLASVSSGSFLSATLSSSNSLGLNMDNNSNYNNVSIDAGAGSGSSIENDNRNDIHAHFMNSVGEESYTSFHDLLLQQEFSNDNSALTLKRSNVTGSKFEDDSFSSDAGRVPGEGWFNNNETHIDESSGVDVDTSSFWYKLSTHLLHPTRSIFILACIMLLFLPIALQQRHMKTSVSFELIVPSKSPSMKTFRRLEKLFGEGEVAPYRLLFDGLNYSDRIDTSDAFEAMHTAIQVRAPLVANFIFYSLRGSRSLILLYLIILSIISKSKLKIKQMISIPDVAVLHG